VEWVDLILSWEEDSEVLEEQACLKLTHALLEKDLQLNCNK